MPLRTCKGEFDLVGVLQRASLRGGLQVGVRQKMRKVSRQRKQHREGEGKRAGVKRMLQA